MSDKTPEPADAENSEAQPVVLRRHGRVVVAEHPVTERVTRQTVNETLRRLRERRLLGQEHGS